jgi:very-short-patch-repair endonuclease
VLEVDGGAHTAVAEQMMRREHVSSRSGSHLLCFLGAEINLYHDLVVAATSTVTLGAVSWP